MRANGEKAEDRPTSVPKAAARSTRPSAATEKYLALQSAVGNTTMAQLLRDAGDPWLAEKHQHGAGCGHHEAGQAVQRSSVPEVLKRSGRPLDPATRADVETKMGGANFSDVRVHDDAAAKASAAEIGAHAYTSGNHIVIGEGGQNTHTLIHELTHVLQQRQGEVSGTVQEAGLKMSDPSDRFERQAEKNATQVMSGGPSLLAPGRAAAGGQQGEVQQSSAQGAENIQRTHYTQHERVTDGPGRSVLLSASLNGVHLGRFSSGTTRYSPRDHAEDQLIDEIESAIGFAADGNVELAAQGVGSDILEGLSHRMRQGREEHSLRIVLSSSPCSTAHGTTTKYEGEDGCMERLIQLASMRFGARGRDRIKIKIKAKKLYQPSHLGRREGKAASQAAINLMEAHGIEVTVG